jgi:putative peptidoglycan lipid II flippase
VGATVSATVLSRRLRARAFAGLLRFVAAVTLAAALAAGLGWLVVRLLLELGVDPASKPGSLLLLVAAGLVAGLGYVGLARLLRLREVTDIAHQLGGGIASRLRRRRNHT